MTFESLALNPFILKALTDSGYTEPTPVQAQAIPIVLAGHDLMASAQTGTGKTAAFMLPALQKLTDAPKAPGKGPRILVLSPTRELAQQITAAATRYGKYLRHAKCVSILGGMPYPVQNRLLASPVDILVATPGRLIDHMQRGKVDFSRLEMLVLDEADRMLDMGFMPDLKRIIALLPVMRQNMMFSATFPEEIQRLANSILKNPQRIEVARRNAVADNLTEIVHPVHHERKRALLVHLVKSRQLSQVLVFTGTKIGANRLANELNKAGLHATAIHGDKSQQERIKALDAFKAGEAHILVATDVAARGLDIEALPHVVNYDLPHIAEDYVHRIGRTGRAGAAGIALSFCDPSERTFLRDIERLTRARLRVVERHPYSGSQNSPGATA